MNESLIAALLQAELEGDEAAVTAILALSDSPEELAAVANGKGVGQMADTFPDPFASTGAPDDASATL